MDSRSLTKQLIAEKKLKAEELAFKSGYSYTTIAQWLAGKSVRPDTEASIRRVLQSVTGSETLATG